MTRASTNVRALAAAALLVSGPLALDAQVSRGSRPWTEHFIVSDSSVRQGAFEAVALSRDSIVSSYPRAAREVRFRFSINGLENEFPSGTEHTIYLRPRNGRMTTGLYTFGVESTPPPPTPEESATGGSEDGAAQVVFRVDLRHVLQSLRERGYYDPPIGARIRRGELRHVYVLGDPEPLTWDYGALRPGSPLELTDADGDGIYTGAVPIDTEYTRPSTADGRAVWTRRLDVSALPQLSSSQILQDALYRMSLEELRQLVREDGALSAGAKWPGVWTRDIALSGILSLSMVAPDAMRLSLMAKVDSSGRIIQDTGTGGSWPVSSDRMVWALAAWELYAATGDRAWLRQAYDIIRRSAEADLHAVRDPSTGLFNGESSFLDWREQSYPRWMQPADIYHSQNLGTNAAHYAAYRVLADMARALGEPSSSYDAIADSTRKAMPDFLWQPSRGYFGQFRYGRNHLSLSPRAEGFGEALMVLTGAATAEQRGTLTRRAPVVVYGTPSFWPYIPGERFYHNAAIWPFVTAYWKWAAAEARNTAAVEHGLDANTRAAALFLTNKENMVASTGHFEGTALNSDRQLWSVAGMLASTYRILLGIRLEPDRIAFRPMVPPSYGGERTLRGLRYRNGTLDVTVRGHGDGIASVTLDGRTVERAEVPADLTGSRVVVITMNGRWPDDTVNMVENRFAPATPQARLRGDTLEWDGVPGAVRYVVYRNGRPADTTTDTRTRIRVVNGLVEHQVLAINAVGDESFLSAPVRVVPADGVRIFQPPARGLESTHSGYTGRGYLPLTLERNLTVDVPIRVDRAGEYSVDVRYANGSGPVNTDARGAIRTLLIGDRAIGVLVMPQRGSNLWTDWGYSSTLKLRLPAGHHVLRIAYTAHDRNMDGSVNTALLDHVRLTRLVIE